MCEHSYQASRNQIEFELTESIHKRAKCERALKVRIARTFTSYIYIVLLCFSINAMLPLSSYTL